MSFAEIIDALRIFPRLLVTAYAYLVGWVTYETVIWYFSLPSIDRNTQVTAFFTMLMGGIFGLSAYIFQCYTGGGFEWDKYYARSQFKGLPVCGADNPVDRTI